MPQKSVGLLGMWGNQWFFDKLLVLSAFSYDLPPLHYMETKVTQTGNASGNGNTWKAFLVSKHSFH